MEKDLIDLDMFSSVYDDVSLTSKPQVFVKS